MDWRILAGYAVPLLMFIGGVLALIAKRRPETASFFGCSFTLLGALSGLFYLIPASLKCWNFCFQFPILILAAAGAVHSIGYLKGHGEERSGFYWFFYTLTAAAMWCVTLANTRIGFLLAWEMMGLASFALVNFDSAKEEVRRAAWIYLLACEAGGFFLILFFFLPFSAKAAFVLAILGFGLKIGFPMLHVWLPEAHPAAPAPVSALMSGAMIQLGFYGLAKWIVPDGWTLLVIGLIAAPWGIMSALPKKNLKALLACSSIENMGILAMGIGLMFIGTETDNRVISACASAGVMLHALNHALLKGGLFLGAGNVLKGMHTLEIDQMGGLLKRMPKTGFAFILNACSLSGLPPFNGFLGEFLLYLAAFYGVTSGKTSLIIAGALVLVVLAFTGGIAAAVYAKAIGGVFLGEPRTEKAARTQEVTKGMNFAVGLLLVLDLAVILASPYLAMQDTFPDLVIIMTKAVIVCISVFLLFVLLAVFHFRKQSRNSITWDCGYAKPDARMEYTGSAFSQPLTDFFAPVLNVKNTAKAPEKLFPAEAKFESTADDPALHIFWKKLFGFAGRFAEVCHKLQSGSLHLYILIMTLALILLLVWGLLLPWGGTLLKGGF